MRSEDIEYITEKLKKKLTPGRFTHTMGVAYTAACMAMRFGEDMEKAYIAGLLHDCAKCISDEEKIKKCEQNGIEISPSEYANPSLPIILNLTATKPLILTEYAMNALKILIWVL